MSKFSTKSGLRSFLRKRRVVVTAGVVCAIVMIMGGIRGSSVLGLTLSGRGQAIPTLSSCEGTDLLFPRSMEQAADAWIVTYNTRVNRVLEAHMKTTPAQCQVGGAMDVPSAELRDLAQTLPPWKVGNQLSLLQEKNMGSVLLEYLRLYECALNERVRALPVTVQQDLGPATSFDLSPFTSEILRQQTSIQRELSVARPALHRTLRYLGGSERLRAIGTEFQCLERASLDIRNVLGLAAEASACMPRIWDARTSLRDL